MEIHAGPDRPPDPNRDAVCSKECVYLMSLMPWRSAIATSRQNSPNLPQQRVSEASPRQFFSHHHLFCA
ncbi:hypothetical protein [Laspinema olomoucense]|uniref:hypothetical protein n=1 Tax=Laspinema olomoucense TaxID=3231600 RepID=UPI0021BA488F|nr:hypothetical protein [Laspinema sp. D3a]MCT7987077.1 hypothetical protein [Laspinema sp. D3a]